MIFIYLVKNIMRGLGRDCGMRALKKLLLTTELKPSLSLSHSRLHFALC